MNKFLLILFFLSSTPAFSQEETSPSERIQGSKELPLELNLLVQTLQDTSLSKENILSTIFKIDSYGRLLNKEDLFLIGKIEIYKTLLKSNEPNTKATISSESLAMIRAALRKARDPFIKWFLQALLHDCDSLISKSDFKDYILQKNNGRLEKLEHKKIHKKVQLLHRWISKLNPDSSDFESTFKTELIPILLEALKNVEQAYFLMAFSSSDSALKVINDPKELKLFRMEKAKAPPKPKPVKEKTVGEILAPVIEPRASATLPEPSNENWLKDDNAPANLKNLPKPSDDADWLEDI